jgi:hypothetical protein
MPVKDDTWICQVCENPTATRGESETMHVKFISCPVCGRTTKHKTIMSDQNPRTGR